MRYVICLTLLGLTGFSRGADDDRDLVIAAWQAMISRYETELAAGKPVGALLERAKLGIFAGLPNFPAQNGDLFLEPGMHGRLPRMKCVQIIDGDNCLVMYAGPMATQTYWLHGNSTASIAPGDVFIPPRKVLVGGTKASVTASGVSITTRLLIVIDDPKAIVKAHIAATK